MAHWKSIENSYTWAFCLNTDVISSSQQVYNLLWKKKTPTSRKGFIKREDFKGPLGKENNWSSGSLLESKSIRKSENNYVVNTQNWKDRSAWKEGVCEKVLIYRSKTVSWGLEEEAWGHLGNPMKTPKQGKENLLLQR